MSKRQMDIHLAYLDSLNKFDHFLLGASLAACAYLAQTNPYGKIGYNIETMYLFSLGALALSAYCGFRRLEEVTGVLRINSHYLETVDRLSQSAREKAWDQMQKVGDRSGRWCHFRNGFLYAGFIAYIGTKVFATYLQP